MEFLGEDVAGELGFLCFLRFHHLQPGNDHPVGRVRLKQQHVAWGKVQFYPDGPGNGGPASFA